MKEESSSMNAWKLLNHHKTQIDEAQKDVDALRRVEQGVKELVGRKQQPEVMLSVQCVASTPVIRLSAAETERVLEILRIMRGQALAQAVERFETIDLSIIDSYDTDNL